MASFAEIRQCADEGNRTVLTVLDTAGEILGAAVADFINIFNPSMESARTTANSKPQREWATKVIH